MFMYNKYEVSKNIVLAIEWDILKYMIVFFVVIVDWWMCNIIMHSYDIYIHNNVLFIG